MTISNLYHPIFVLLGVTASLSVFAAENCTNIKKRGVCPEKVVAERVRTACSLLENKGKDAIPEVKESKYSCCGEPNYIFILGADGKMIMHPQNPTLDDKDVNELKDSGGTPFIKNILAAAKVAPKGSWVPYRWPKAGEKFGTPKKSFVKSCKVMASTDTWIVGSGTWLK